MIPTSNYSARYGGRVRLVALHTTEGATDVDALGAFFRTGTKNASYHGAFDDQRYESFVNYSQAAWALRSGNGISDNAAFCCAAVRDHWTAADWMRHPRMLELGAAWTADRCLARGVPIRRLSLAEVRACKNDPSHPGGVIMHRDWTLGAPDGTHTDCGDAFVWDWFLNRARQIAHVGSAPAPPPPTREVDEPVSEIRLESLGKGAWRGIRMTEAGSSSSVVKRAWVSFGVGWGGQADFLITHLNRGGQVVWDKTVGPPARRTVGNNHGDVVPVPDGAYMTTVEVSNAGTAIPTAELVVEPK